MDDYRDVALWMVEAAWTGSPRGEAHNFQRAAICVFPNGTRIASAVDTANLFRHKMRCQPKLLREGHVQWPLWDAVEMRLAHIDETQSEVLALSDSLFCVLRKQHLLRLERRS